MPIRTNRAYNDPNIGAAFDNIASIFAPPDANDVAAYAAAAERRAGAAAKREEAARAEEAWNRMTTEGAAPSVVDLFGVAAGIYNPSQSYRALEMGDATQRYGVDVNASTSRANNAADNVRALTDREMQEAGAMSRLGVTDATDRRGQDVVAATSTANNAADNARALRDRRMQEDGALARFFAAPVTVKQGERAYLPNQTAAATGLPAQLDGNTAPLSTDEVAALAMQSMPSADREQFVRDKFAPTDSQVQGQERRDLRSSGLLSDDDLKATIMGSVPVEEAIGPNGQPQFVRRTDAVGMRPAPKAPMVNVNTGEAADGKLRGKLDESEGKRLSDLQASAVTSAGLRQDLGLMDQLIDQAPQGPLVGRLATLFPGVSDAGTAFQSIVERAAPGLRVEGSGATSDIEFRGMLNSLPQLRNRPEANRLIASMMKAKADINIRRGDLVTAYQNSDIDASQMRRQLADLNRQSIVTPELSAMIEAVGGGAAPMSGIDAGPSAPSPGSIVDGHRFRGGDPADPASWEAL